jgi:hypothetical protein
MSKQWKVCAGDATYVQVPGVAKPISCGSQERAHLIAAAPALLEACKAALIQAEGCFLNHYPGDDPATAPTPENIVMLDAAIRAAEGKQP